MQDRDKLIERIRKLLAVTEGRGATEAEAIAAALAAQRLMAENDVEQWELQGEGEPMEAKLSPKTKNWMIFLAKAVADNFRCKIAHYLAYEGGSRRKAYIEFFGYRSDAEAARLVYERLADVCNRKANEWARLNASMRSALGSGADRRDFYNSFVRSFVDGVRSELEKQSQALMIVCPPKVSEAFCERTAGSGEYRAKQSRYRRDGASERAGYSAGRDAVRERRVGAASAERLLEI